MEDNKYIQEIIIDALVERPCTFIVGKRRFCIYPQTLGKSLLISHLIKELEIRPDFLQENNVLEIMRVCSVKKPVAARIIAYSVTKNKEDIFDNMKIEKLTRYFSRQKTEDVASLINAVLSQDKAPELIKHYSLDTEIGYMKKAQNAKKEGSDITFCGKTLWGNTIDAACERYGWTMEYVMWGISYTNLQMLLADQVKTIYLTEEERKKVHIPNRGGIVHNAENMTAEDMKKVLNIN